MNKKKDIVITALDRILDFNFTIFPLLWFIGVTFCFIEAFTYQGIISKHLLLDMKLVVIFIISSGLFTVLTYISKADRKFPALLRFLYLFSILVFPVTVLIAYILYAQLRPNRNSVIINGSYLIFPGRLILAASLILFFIFIYNSITKLNPQVSQFLKRSNKNFKQSLLKMVLFATFFWIFIYSFNKDFRLFKFNVGELINNPIASYDEKMTNQIGPIYNYYKFVNKYSREEALILNPKQQGQWPDVSNQGFTRYFIYPRNLLSEEDLEKSKSEVDFVFLIGDRKLHDNNPQNRWPDFYVPAKRVFYYPNDVSKDVIEVQGDYQPENVNFPDYWGLIEVDHSKKW